MPDVPFPTRLRRRIEDWTKQLVALHAESATGSVTCVVVTYQKTTYPTIAASYFACQVQRVSGTETEGSAVTLTPTGATLFAANLGTAIPPPGTSLLATVCGSRWVFRYDG